MSNLVQENHAVKRRRHRRTQSSSTNELKVRLSGLNWKEWTSKYLKSKDQGKEEADPASEKRTIFLSCLSNEATKRAIFASVDENEEKKVIIDKLENENELLRDNSRMLFLPAFLRNNYVNSVSFNISIRGGDSAPGKNNEEKRKKYLNLLNLKQIDEEIGKEGNVCSLSPKPRDGELSLREIKEQGSSRSELQSSRMMSSNFNGSKDSLSSISQNDGSKAVSAIGEVPRKSESDAKKYKKAKPKITMKKNTSKRNKRIRTKNSGNKKKDRKKILKKNCKTDLSLNNSKSKIGSSRLQKQGKGSPNSKKTKKTKSKRNIMINTSNITPSSGSKKHISYLQKIQSYSKSSKQGSKGGKLKKFTKKYLTDFKDFYKQTPNKGQTICLSTSNIKNNKISNYTKSARSHRRTHSDTNSFSQLSNFYTYSKPQKKSSLNLNKESLSYLKYKPSYKTSNSAISELRKSTGRTSQRLPEQTKTYASLLRNVTELEGKLKDYEFLVSELRKENSNLRKKNMLLDDRNQAKKKVIDRQNLELQKYEEFVKITEFNFYSLKEQNNFRDKISSESTFLDFKRWLEKNRSCSKSDATEETKETISTPQKKFSLTKGKNIMTTKI